MHQMLPNKGTLLDRVRFFKVLRSWFINAAFYSLDERFVGSLAGLSGEYCHPAKNSVKFMYLHIFYFIFFYFGT